MPTYETTLKPETLAALKTWLGLHWHTSHPCDMERFFDFVNAYELEHGTRINEIELRAEVERILGRTLAEMEEEILDRRLSAAIDILDFLKHTDRASQRPRAVSLGGR